MGKVIPGFTTITIKLNAERDADLIEWASRQVNVSSAIRAALRQKADDDPLTRIALALERMSGQPILQQARDGDISGVEEAAGNLAQLGV